MFNTFLCIVFQGAISPFWGIIFEKMLEVNNEKTSSRFRILCWTVGLLIFTSVKIVFLDIPAAQIGSYLFVVLCFVVFMRFFYKDPVWKKIVACALMFLCAFMSDFVVQSIYQIYITTEYAWQYDNPHLVIISFLVTIMTIIVYLVMSSVWCLVFKKTKVINHPFIFIVLLLAEFCAIFPSVYLIFKEGSYLFEFDFIIVSSMIMIITLAFILYDQSQKDVIQNEYKNAKQLMELEKTHYSEVEKRRVEMDKLRDNYKSFVSSAVDMLENGDTSQAEAVLQQFSQKIDSTRETPFCHIPVINSILTDKEIQCKAKNIDLSVNIVLPQSVVVTQLELCSVFGNLIDNAIKACCKISEDDKREIRLFCGVSGKYIIFECINPALSGVKDAPEGTGYGFKILNSFAQKYNGDFRTSYADGDFTAQLSLLNVDR